MRFVLQNLGSEGGPVCSLCGRPCAAGGECGEPIDFWWRPQPETAAEAEKLAEATGVKGPLALCDECAKRLHTPIHSVEDGLSNIEGHGFAAAEPDGPGVHGTLT